MAVNEYYPYYDMVFDSYFKVNYWNYYKNQLLEIIDLKLKRL